MGKFTQEFSGWSDEPSLRPLILVSRNNTSDPQNWKPIQPSKPLLQNCVKEFKKNVGPVTFCDKQYGQKPTTNFADNLIHHIKSYKSNDGQYLVSFQLEMSRNKCEDVQSDTWAASWFHVNKEGSVRYIGRGMTLLDAGDYDNDGESEIIFWRSGYNEDGYILFYKQFINRVDFTWNYH